MHLILDNIIFSLQKAGGISNIWKYLIDNLTHDRAIKLKVLEDEKASNNLFRAEITIEPTLIIKDKELFLKINRYFNIKKLSKHKHIFHSSYYRTEFNPVAINIISLYDFIYEKYRLGLPRLIHSWQKYKSIKFAKGIICISESTKKDLLNWAPEFQDKPIKVIYCPINPAFQPLPPHFNFTKRHPFEDYSYALFVGDNKTQYKNFNLAVEACHLFKFRLLIIGGGTLNSNQIFFLNKTLGPNNYYSLLNVNSQELNYYYNKAYCLLYPSHYEGFGIPVVEAQKAGCPVIATQSSSIPEVIGNKDCALSSPTPLKISFMMKQLAINSKFRQETIEMGFEKAAYFKYEKSYQETKEFYLEMYENN